MTCNSSTIRVSAILAARRKELNLSQKAISDYLGLKSPEHIGLIERGKRSIDLNRVPLLADVLKFDRADLTKMWLAENAPLACDALFGEKPSADRSVWAAPATDILPNSSDPCRDVRKTETPDADSAPVEYGEAVTTQG